MGLILVLALGFAGGVTPLGVSCIAAASTALVWAVRQRVFVNPLTGVLFALSAICLLQIVPLPLPVLGALSPAALRVYEETGLMLGDVPGMAPISIDPEATRLEALQLLGYAAFGVLAGTVARRFGARPLALLVVGATGLLALTGLLHAVADAEAVFGWYRPNYSAFIAPLMNSNNLSGALNLGFFCAAGLALDDRLAWGGRRALAVTAGLLSGASAWAGSRGGVLVLGLGLLCFVLLTAVRRRTSSSRLSRLELGLFVLAALLGASLAGFSALRLERELLDSSMHKLEVIEPALGALSAHWLFGAGRGAFSVAVSPHVAPTAGQGSFEHAENFPLQWAVDWGVPLAVVLCALLLWWLWPGRRLLRASPTRLGVYLALVGLVVHNLADFSLEVPFVALLAVTCAFALPEREVGRSLLPRSLVWGERRGVPILAVTTAVVLAWTLVDPVERSRTARRHIATAAERGTLTSAALHRALRAHPADAYLLRMRALLASQRGEPRAFRFVGWALERAPNSGRTLLVLSDVLQRQGATEQALGALRRAVAAEPSLADPVAARASAWAPERLHLVVPAGPAAATTWTALAQRTGDPERRLELRRRAVEAEPGNRRHGVSLLRDALAVTDDVCVAVFAATCESEVRRRRAELGPSASARIVEIDATLLRRAGRLDAAFELLDEKCPRARTGVGCLRTMFSFSSAMPLARQVDSADSFLRFACDEAASCIAAEDYVGRELLARGHAAVAVAHLQRAADDGPERQRFERLGRAAIEARDARALQRALDGLSGLGVDVPVEWRNALRELEREAMGVE